MKPKYPHTTELDLALYAGGDLGFFARRTVTGHLEKCEECRSRHQQYLDARTHLRECTAELPSGLNWDRLTAEMTANIHLGLVAGEIVALNHRPRQLTGWRPAMVFASALLVVLMAWYANRPTPAQLNAQKAAVAFDPPQVLVKATDAGIELKDHGRVLTLLHPKDRDVAYSVSMQGSVRARYIDSESGQVTINNVYVQ